VDKNGTTGLRKELPTHHFLPVRGPHILSGLEVNADCSCQIVVTLHVICHSSLTSISHSRTGDPRGTVQRATNSEQTTVTFTGQDYSLTTYMHVGIYMRICI
jgi:hypothetical protein